MGCRCGRSFERAGSFSSVVSVDTAQAEQALASFGEKLELLGL
jgi:hypothetical protein